MKRGAGNVIVLKSSIAVQEGASTQSNAIGCIDLRSGLLAAARQGRPRAALRYLRRLMGPLQALREEQSTAGLLDQISLVFLACERGGESSLAEQWLHRIRAAGHAPTAEHFWYSMKAFAKKGLSRDAERCFREMLRCCLQATAMECTMMIRASGKSGDSQRALAWLMRMHGAQLTVDVFAYNAVLGAYSMEGDFRSALNLVKAMESGFLHSIKPDAASYAAAANACTSSETRRRHHLADLAEQLVERSRSAMMEVDGAVYRKLLRHGARQGDAERVGRLLSRMAALCTDPGPSAILEALSACSTAPFLGLAGNLLEKHPRGALLLARPFVELGDWRRVQRLGRDTGTAMAVLQGDTVCVWPMLRLMALSEAVPRRRQKCLEAAADFLLAGGQLSAKDENPCSAAAVLLRRGLGGRAVSHRHRNAAGHSPLRSSRQSHLGCASRVSAALDAEDPKQAEVWLRRWMQLACLPRLTEVSAADRTGPRRRAIVSWRDHEVSPLMRRQEEVRRSMQDRGNTGKPSPQQRYRESAEERGLAAAARLAAAVAAATSHHPAPAVQAHASAENFRLRRHSTGCRTAPGQPTPSVRQAWTDDRQDAKERPREGPQSEMRARETRQPRVAPGEVAPRIDTSPLRPRLARAQSARRPTRPSAPARARSADPRRRQEGAFGGFVPERREEADPSLMEDVAKPEKPRPSGPAGIPSPRLHGAQAAGARRSTGQILTATVAAVASRRASTGSMSIMDQQPTPFRSLSSKIFSGSYSVAKFLGRGASASVWEAVRSDNEQRVAVKVFDQGQRDKRQAHREMKVLSRVRHPRIVEAFEVIETPRYAQLVCEVGEKAEAIKHSERFQRLQERTSVVVASAAEGVKRAREKIGRPANAIEFEAQLESRAKSTRTLASIVEMHKSWVQSISAGNKEGPRVVSGDHELGFKEMFLQSRALEYSME
ncbi:cmk2, partial [Symbiodinium necroappetens]